MEVVAAAGQVANEGIKPMLFGVKEQIDSELKAGGVDPGLVDVFDAPEVIGNGEEPARAARRKRNSSIVMAAKAVAEGRADALVSSGPTGATLASGVLYIKRMRGVHRPAIAAQLPTSGKPCILLDVGANAQSKSEHLVQFAFMGAALARIVLEAENPSVALLSVGEEAGKGTEEVVEAHAQLKRTNLNFVGNIEGRDLPAGRVDVAVCDGFTGNVSLKLMEGTARMVKDAISDAARSSASGKIGGLLLKPSMKSLRQQMDPNRTGGALLVGLRAGCIVAHGNADRTGIASAIRLADKTVKGNIVEQLSEMLADGKAMRRKTSSNADSVFLKL